MCCTNMLSGYEKILLFAFAFCAASASSFCICAIVWSLFQSWTRFSLKYLIWKVSKSTRIEENWEWFRVIALGLATYPRSGTISFIVCHFLRTRLARFAVFFYRIQDIVLVETFEEYVSWFIAEFSWISVWCYSATVLCFWCCCCYWCWWAREPIW